MWFEAFGRVAFTVYCEFESRINLAYWLTYDYWSHLKRPEKDKSEERTEEALDDQQKFIRKLLVCDQGGLPLRRKLARLFEIKRSYVQTFCDAVFDSPNHPMDLDRLLETELQTASQVAQLVDNEDLDSRVNRAMYRYGRLVQDFRAKAKEPDYFYKSDHVSQHKLAIEEIRQDLRIPTDERHQWCRAFTDRLRPANHRDFDPASFAEQLGFRWEQVFSAASDLVRTLHSVQIVLEDVAHVSHGEASRTGMTPDSVDEYIDKMSKNYRHVAIQLHLYLFKTLKSR